MYGPINRNMQMCAFVETCLPDEEKEEEVAFSNIHKQYYARLNNIKDTSLPCKITQPRIFVNWKISF